MSKLPPAGGIAPDRCGRAAAPRALEGVSQERAAMQVQVTTDNHIPGSAELTASVREALLAALDRFQPQLTRVDAHLRDQNSRQKRGQDIACTLEARLSGLAPVAATATGDTVQQAVHAATEKLVALLSRRLGRLADRRPDTSPSGDATE